jgi:tetratricopeptide (TPR) repeat protein
MIEARFADSPALGAHMLVVLASRFYEVADYVGWRRVLTRAHELAETTSDPRLRAVAACELAMAEADEDAERATALFAKANVELAGLDAASAAAELARCRSDEATFANFRGDHEAAVRAAEESLRFEASRPGPAGRGIDALNSLALAQGYLGRYEEANRSFEKLFELLAAERRTRTRTALVHRHNWVVMLSRAGQIRRALGEADTIVAVSREVGGRKASPYALSARASLLSYSGRHAEAIATAEESIAGSAQGAGSQVPLWTNCVAARIYAEAGDTVAADRALAEVDRALAAIPAAPAWFSGFREIYRAVVLVERGPESAAEALAHAGRAIEILEREQRPDSDLLAPLLIAARAANDLGDGAAAAPYAARALAMARAGLGGFAHSRELGLAELEAARAALSTGDRAGAHAGFRRAVENLRETVGPDGPDTRRAERQAAAAGAAVA